MSEEKQKALFTKWADDEYGPTMPPKFLPQTERYESYWKCWQTALASQPKPAPVLLTDGEIGHAGFSTEFARAIESAVLRKNGWGG